MAFALARWYDKTNKIKNEDAIKKNAVLKIMATPLLPTPTGFSRDQALAKFWGDDKSEDCCGKKKPAGKYLNCKISPDRKYLPISQTAQCDLEANRRLCLVEAIIEAAITEVLGIDLEELDKEFRAANPDLEPGKY